MKDYTFTATVSPDGLATDVQGFDEYLKGATKDLPEETAGMFASMLTDKMIRDAVQSQYYAARKEPAKIGDSWEHVQELDQPMIGKIKYVRTYTFSEVADKGGRSCVHLTLKGDIQSDGGTYEYKDIDWTGDTWLDAKTGEVVLVEGTMKFTMKMTMGTTVVEIPSETKSTQELIVEEKKPAIKEPAKD